MKFSESWLRQWVNPAISTEQLVAQLTMAGLEVDAVEQVAGAFSGVVVGEIAKIDAHPDAEKLRVCQVNYGAAEPIQVVCGAANARAGLKVPFATVGAQLPGDFKIKKAKLRGVESFGMLCAQTELEAGEDDSGLWELPEDAPVGQDLREYLSLNDTAIEVDLTPNRGDCLSIRGLAREVGVLNSVNVEGPKFSSVEASVDDTFSVNVQAKAECPVYLGRVVKNVDISAPSPLWLVERLRRSGVRSIDAVVDVTNYVMLELGQPMHAFDLDKLSGGIEVRLSKPAESLTLLDGQSIELKPETLLICDAKGPLAMAGIMGGAESAVSKVTQNVFLESAFFAQTAMAGKARSYGLHTDSSHRFERGVDALLQRQALERATELLLNICGGSAGPVVDASQPTAAAAKITLRKPRLASALGLQLDDAVVLNILTRLGLECLDESDASWTFAAPSYRFDLAIEEDLVEEVARVYGYDNLPVNATTFAINLPKLSETEPDADETKSHLVSRGFQEVITYSFVDPGLHQHFLEANVPVLLQNPISSEMSSMRSSLLPGLVQVLKTNLNRQKQKLKCFEAGLRFRAADGTAATLKQDQAVAGLLYGSNEDASWFGKARDADFYDLKGDVESLLQVICKGKSIEFIASDAISYMHPGQTASVVVDGAPVGYIGSLHPATQKALGFNKSVFVFELDLETLLSRPLPSFAGISRYPEVSRDLAVVVAKDVPFQRVRDIAYAAAGNCLTQLKLFDVYRGEGIDPERKSLAFSLTFQHPSRTLNEDEINASMASVVSRLESELGGTLR